MFRKAVYLVMLVFCAAGFSLLCTATEAGCEHNFTPLKDKSNVIYGADMSHSYRCLNGCGEYGTVKDGLHGREKCSLKLAYEAPATCTEKGIRFYFCSVCSQSKEEILSLINHSYKLTRRLPTCTSQGCDIHTCSFCKHSFKDNYKKPISHISDGGVVETLPTYEKKGVLKTSCRVCGYVIGKKSLPKLIKAPVKTASVESVSGFKVKSYGEASVKLMWKKSDGAVSYRIYYSTDKKKWKTASVKKTSATVKKLKPATKYYFKITAVGTDISSKESRIISACTKPAIPTLQKVKSAGKSAVTLQWKKLANVSGYELSYTAESFSKKKTVKTVYITKSTKKTLKKLKSGKKYSFRVRAYKKYASKKIFSSYSAVRTFKIK